MAAMAIDRQDKQSLLKGGRGIRKIHRLAREGTSKGGRSEKPDVIKREGSVQQRQVQGLDRW